MACILKDKKCGGRLTQIKAKHFTPDLVEDILPNTVLNVCVRHYGISRKCKPCALEDCNNEKTHKPRYKARPMSDVRYTQMVAKYGKLPSFKVCHSYK